MKKNKDERLVERFEILDVVQKGSLTFFFIFNKNERPTTIVNNFFCIIKNKEALTLKNKDESCKASPTNEDGYSIATPNFDECLYHFGFYNNISYQEFIIKLGRSHFTPFNKEFEAKGCLIYKINSDVLFDSKDVFLKLNNKNLYSDLLVKLIRQKIKWIYIEEGARLFKEGTKEEYVGNKNDELELNSELNWRVIMQINIRVTNLLLFVDLFPADVVESSLLTSG